jgi:hypothetical protein
MISKYPLKFVFISYLSIFAFEVVHLTLLIVLNGAIEIVRSSIAAAEIASCYNSAQLPTEMPSQKCYIVKLKKK